MKTYNNIQCEVEFKEYSASEEGHVRAEWKVTLKNGKDKMDVPFFTGLRELSAPKGFSNWFDGWYTPISNQGDREVLDAGLPGGLAKRVTDYLKAEFKVGGVKFVGEYPKERVERIKREVRPKAPTKQEILYTLASNIQDCASFEE